MHKLFGTAVSKPPPTPVLPASSKPESKARNTAEGPASYTTAQHHQVSKSAPTLSPTNFLLSNAYVKPPTLPRLPPSNDDKRYSLVLDLDETLLHTQLLPGQQGQFIVHERPFVRELLRSLKQLPLEVIVFTAGLQGYADAVLDILDRGTATISHRLYRQHTTSLGFQRWKDLSLLDRDLNRVLIVDNSPEVFRYHSRNGLAICPWEGHNPIIKDKEETAEPKMRVHDRNIKIDKEVIFEHKNDYALAYLLFWLEFMVTNEISVPVFLQRFHPELRRCLSREGASSFPVGFPFQIGSVSLEFTTRCLLPAKALYHPIIPPPALSSGQSPPPSTTATVDSAAALTAAAAAVSAVNTAAATAAAAAVTASAALGTNHQDNSASTASARVDAPSRASSRRSSPSASTNVLAI